LKGERFNHEEHEEHEEAQKAKNNEIAGGYPGPATRKIKMDSGLPALLLKTAGMTGAAYQQ
jgi:hypothetical protein